MFWPAFLALSALGLIGIAVFAATAPRSLLDLIPVAGTARKRLIIASQPALLLIGLAAAGSAVAEAAASKSLIVDAIRGIDLPANWLGPIAIFFLVGIAVGALLYLVDRWWRPWWGKPGDSDLIADWQPQSLVSGLTYGGLTEEVLMRWGIMGVVLWALTAVTGSGGEPGPAIATVAILISALLFGAGHLPAALMEERGSARFITRIVTLNTVAGLLFGWLFWQWNLETAMAAHAGFHVGAALLVVALRGVRGTSPG